MRGVGSGSSQDRVRDADLPPRVVRDAVAPAVRPGHLDEGVLPLVPGGELEQVVAFLDELQLTHRWRGRRALAVDLGQPPCAASPHWRVRRRWAGLQRVDVVAHRLAGRLLERTTSV